MFREEYISLKVLKNNLNFNRFGFVVSGKVSKKSVERNKIKRRLRETVRLKLPGTGAGYDIVIVAKPEIKDKAYQEIEKIINKILAKLL